MRKIWKEAMNQSYLLAENLLMAGKANSLGQIFATFVCGEMTQASRCSKLPVICGVMRCMCIRVPAPYAMMMLEKLVPCFPRHGRL
uniref:Uncharacterized protein n=1 Tax=Candidatus Kentrum sp. MB TaxID=2138164 RepID=A0A450XLU2_9GAMM|nr:MAG: hypothetical protein BECKMB1821G_GA0114241_10612 [Candidatus Kentron sp. MB]VFK34163.1 MAG: hypothetical protein BECKMB1821I_GA0114274_10632 [Candidatus Kentron sp. MB]VFK76734.1 MAG: hypothetical protein BECKMB1821H_GA0114242_107118 [Candidatus Kentron sp. MB]